MDRGIILELIPTKFKNGDIIQLSSLKLNDLKLIDRFDFRLNEDKIPYVDLINLINYDKEKFVYKNTTDEIINEFKNWIEDYPIYILDNKYTLNYLDNLNNEKKFKEKELDLEYSDDIIEKIIKKYNIKPSNYIVDILYEALLYKD